MWQLHVSDLTLSYGTRTVLRGWNFHSQARVIGLAGPNGSGKTTLLKTLAGLRAAQGGSVAWRHPDNRPPCVGFAGPYIGLHPELTVLEHLVLVRDLRGLGDPAVEAALERTGLAAIRGQAVSACSSGQQQRVRLALAVIHQPDILFLDEPGSNLDAAGSELVRALVADWPGAVVIASNDAAELAWCHEIHQL